MKRITWAAALLVCFATVTGGEGKPRGVVVQLSGRAALMTKAAAETLQAELLAKIKVWNDETKAVVGQDVTVGGSRGSFSVDLTVRTQGMSIARASTFFRELILMCAAKGEVVLTLFIRPEEE